MEQSCSPILLTIFNRPEHTARLFEVIKKIKPIKLFISADGPRVNNLTDKALCRAARKVISVDWDCEVWWHTSKKNLGYNRGMMEGISWFFKYVEEGIVLEDECLPDLSFFPYCSELLTKYRNDERIFGISGNHFHVDTQCESSYYFLKLIHTNGWAAWRRSWQLVDTSTADEPRLKHSKELHYVDSTPNTWADSITDIMHKHDMLGIFPSSNLVIKYGFSKSDTYETPKEQELEEILLKPIQFPLVHPAIVGLSVGFDKCAKNVLDIDPASNTSSQSLSELGCIKMYSPDLGRILSHQITCLSTTTLEMQVTDVIQTVETDRDECLSQPEASDVCLTSQKVILHDPNMGETLRRLMGQQIGDVTNEIVTNEIVTNEIPSEKANNTQIEPASLFNIDLPFLLSLDNDEFINTAYITILGRTSDEAGRHYYQERLNNGISRIQILGQLAASKETKVARDWYKKLRGSYLRLKYKNVPVIGWVCELISAFTRDHIKELLTYNNEQFIANSFKAILGRNPDTVGLMHYMNQLTAGQNKIAVLADIRNSKEGKVAGNRVAGLTVISLGHRLRNLPFIKWVSDIFILPQVVLESLQRVRGMELSIQRMEMQRQSDINVIRELSKREQEATLELMRQFNQYKDETFLRAEQEKLILSDKLELIHKQILKSEFNLTDTVNKLKDEIANNAIKLEMAKAATTTLINTMSAEVFDKLNLVSMQILKSEGSFKKLKDKIANNAIKLEMAKAATTTLINTMSTEVFNKLNLVSMQILKSEGSFKKLKDEIANNSIELEAMLERLACQLIQNKTDIVNVFSGESTNVFNELSKVEENILALINKTDKNYSHTNEIQSVLMKFQVNADHKMSEIVAYMNASLPSIINEAKKVILAQLVLAERASEQLCNQIDLATLSTVSLIRNENALASNSTHKLASDLQEKMAGIQTELNHQIQKIVTPLYDILPKTLQEIKAALIERTLESEKAQEELRKQAICNTTELSSEIHKHSNEMQTALQEIQFELARQIDKTVTQFNTMLPQSAEDTKATVLARLSEDSVSRDQLLSKIHHLAPQIDRIELYSLASARRVAIPCGLGTVMVKTNVGYVLCEADDHALIACLIDGGELESGTRHLIQRILNPGDTFIDVGANIGMHTLAAAQSMQGQGQVIAFEPYPQTAQLLEKTVWMSGFSNMVQVHCLAASDEVGERILHLGVVSGHHSLFPLEGVFATNKLPIKVNTTTVDKIMAHSSSANLIKIDAEGAELEVLEGASALLKRSKNVAIIAEFGGSHLKRIDVTPQKWLAKFRQLGFECQAIHPKTGALNDISIEELEKIDSINLFFARPQSPIWEKAGGLA